MNKSSLFCAGALPSAPEGISRSARDALAGRLYALVTLIAVCLVASGGCAKDPQGTLEVKVVFRDRTAAAGVTVTLDPSGRTGVTDAKGSVTFEALDAMTYEVVGDYRELEGFQRALVLEDQLIQVTVYLSGDLASLEPIALEVDTPFASDTFFVQRNIALRGRVTQAGPPAKNAYVAWSVPALNLSGNTFPKEDGRFAFDLQFREPGTYSGFLEVKGDYPTDTRLPFTITVAPTPSLTLTAKAVADGVRLDWSQYWGPRPFLWYAIYREIQGCDAFPTAPNWENIAIIPGEKNLSFVDTAALPLTRTVCYYVTTGDYPGSIASANVSNRASYQSTDYKWMNFRPEQVVAHPTAPNLVYATLPTSHRVVLYDLNTGKELSSVKLSGYLWDLSVADAGRGTEVFVTSNDGRVCVLDPNTLAERLRISAPGGAYAVAAFEDGFVLVSDERSSGAVPSFSTYRRSDGRLIARSTTKDQPSKLRRIPGERAVIAVGSDDNSPIVARFIRLDAIGGFSQEITYGNPGANPLSSRQFAMSPEGSYWGSGYPNLFLANETMEYQGSIREPTGSGAGVAISRDGKEIYLAVNDKYGTGTRSNSALVTYAYPSRVETRRRDLPSTASHICMLADGSVLTVLPGSRPRSGSIEGWDVAMVVVHP